MSLADDLRKEVRSILRTSWSTRDGRIVPDTDDIKLGNDAVELDSTVLYADIAKSSELVSGYKNWFAAEIYKSFLYCSAKIIRDHDGKITSFDGDRIMGVFAGDSKNSSAGNCALKINHTVTQIINPEIKEHFTSCDFKLRHATGIDTGELFIIRAGIRGSNDLIWIANASNNAARLSTIRLHDNASYITPEVFNRLNDDTKYHQHRCMWDKFYDHSSGHDLYKSTWRRAP